ncbi:BZ3500_MvSof-1268-A1-R1_Chr5-1g07593 [Microbotryum saponariae]|uniref:BZ3500_MvSof-1268-A1-R1_Chr5-1g07593 protein n=1 Tax=Microbotryum saponariae TaxID=289078 RepID=A0A2X0KJ21_9BASI|nr:BZ3500_MvSof-1268-A1-R1_Chr5-1g07593 [Microbotryum saponariae]SDA05464.1 BZ3501_MvSof-1269-A2-R1_Chr5-2g07417 [Microbotryum saponariae]
MDPDELTHHIDALLCITSNSADHASALMALEVGLAGLVVGSEHDEGEEEESLRERVRRPKPTTRLDAFLRLQDRFEYNITTVLLHWLGSSIVIMTQPRIDQLGQSLLTIQVAALAEPDRCRGGTDTDLLRSNLIRCLALLQGLLLMHRPSRALFVRRSAVQSLLAVLDLSRPSHVSSPLLSHPPASPSPIHFPSPTTTSHHPSTPRTARSSSPPSSLSTSTSPPNRTPPQTNLSNPKNDPSRLSLAALEALLCAVVDRAENMRTFEQVGGLATIVRMLKDKTVGQSVRIKVIELLYYFLLPEQEPHTSNTAHPSPTPNEIDPNPRPHTPPITSTTPTKSPSKRSFVLPREERLAHASRGFVPQTPVKVRRFRNGSGSDEDVGDSSPSEEAEEREEEEDERTPRRSNGNGRTMRSGKEVVSVGKRVTRTTKEKKEMLRKVMPNVDALEERFRAMGLGLGLG